jgi:hypothetical protein
MKNYISIPLSSSSPFKKICNTRIHPGNLWRDKLIKKIYLSYKKAKYFDSVYPIIEELIRYETDDLSKYLVNIILCICKCLNIKTDIIETSRIYANDHLHGQDRIIDICTLEKADKYINSYGGVALYSSNDFKRMGVELLFLQSFSREYQQFDNEFIPNLSVIDIMMHVPLDEISLMLQEYELGN